jgi:DNA modification methylase
MPDVTLLHGDCREQLATLPAASVQTCITSPPYFGLRDYQVAGQIGLESSVDAYVAALVDVFRAVRRVLRPDGTLWLNLGDSYANSKAGNTNGGASSGLKRDGRAEASRVRANVVHEAHMGAMTFRKPTTPGLDSKQLLGIPWRVAFALQADGWVLRSDIIWSKPNAMPESVTDRPTKAHEYLFLLAPGPRYYYDADAIREPLKPGADHDRATVRVDFSSGSKGHLLDGDASNGRFDPHVMHSNPAGRNKRTVWTVATRPYKGAHFATFPPDLIRPCVLAGSRPGDTVLDPFNGAGTTGVVALEAGRAYIGCELNAEYLTLTRARLATVQPLMQEVA